MKGEITKNLSKNLFRFLSHFRYPSSLPEDIASDLGVKLPKISSFTCLIEKLSQPHLISQKLYYLMPKNEAEKVFVYALKKETFKTNSLFSYHFNEGWLVVNLYFNNNYQLERVYVQCPSCGVKEGFDISLSQKPYKLLNSESLINV